MPKHQEEYKMEENKFNQFEILVDVSLEDRMKMNVGAMVDFANIYNIDKDKHTDKDVFSYGELMEADSFARTMFRNKDDIQEFKNKVIKKKGKKKNWSNKIVCCPSSFSYNYVFILVLSYERTSPLQWKKDLPFFTQQLLQTCFEKCLDSIYIDIESFIQLFNGKKDTEKCISTLLTTCRNFLEDQSLYFQWAGKIKLGVSKSNYDNYVKPFMDKVKPDMITKTTLEQGKMSALTLMKDIKESGINRIETEYGKELDVLQMELGLIEKQSEQPSKQGESTGQVENQSVDPTVSQELNQLYEQFEGKKTSVISNRLNLITKMCNETEIMLELAEGLIDLAKKEGK